MNVDAFSVVVDRSRPLQHQRHPVRHVVEAGNERRGAGAEPDVGVVHLGRVVLREQLAAGAQVRRELVVAAHRFLPPMRLHGRLDALVVVAVGRRVARVVVRQGPVVQHVQADAVEPALRNPAEHAAVLEAAGGVGGAARQPGGVVADIRVQGAVVVARLGEVSLAFELGRHAEPRHLTAGRARPPLLAEEEEQLVAPARLADRAADGVAPVLFLRDGLRRCRCACSTSCCCSSRNCARCRTPSRGTGWCRSW